MRYYIVTRRPPLGPPPEPPAFVPDRYIGPNGNNGNSGEEGAPWALSALTVNPNGLIVPGTQIGLLDGTYVVTGNGNGNGGHQIPIDLAGTQANPIVIRPVNKRVPLITQNNGGSYPTATVAVFGLNGQWVRLLHMRFAQLGMSAVQINGQDLYIGGFEVFDVVGSRVAAHLAGDNCGAFRCYGENQNAARVLIEHTRVERIRGGAGGGPGGNNEACFGPNYGVNGLEIRFCTALDAHSGYYFKNFSTNCNFHHNFAGGGIQRPFYGTPYEATNQPTGLNQIHHNVAEDVQEFYEGDVASRASNMLVYNNTLVFSTEAANVSGQAKYGNPLGAGDPFIVDFYNNIMAYRGSPSDQHRLSGSCPPASSMFGVLNFNAYRAAGFSMEAANGATLASLAAWQAHVGASRELQSIVTDDPLFVVGTGQIPENYRLQSGSPCRGTGSVGGLVGGGPINMGAYELDAQTDQIGHNWAVAPEV